MWLVLLLLHYAYSTETYKGYPIIKHIDTCADVGYFFKREPGPNLIEPQCYLCFCQENNTAVCWPRQNRRCDAKHYYQRKRRQSRARRSPGFADIFFRDAARDIFNRQTPEECKPFESSFSEGCPPADWCVGCTVCDCDANGRWDCHILSFCTNDKGKKKMRKKKTTVQNMKNKRHSASPTRPTTSKISITTIKSTKEPVTKKIKVNLRAVKMDQNKTKIFKTKQKQINNTNKKQNNAKGNKMNRTTQIHKTLTTRAIKKRPVTSNTKPSPKMDYSKVSKKPVVLETKMNKKDDINNAVKYAQIIMKRVMKSVEKILAENRHNSTKNPIIIQKQWEKTKSGCNSTKKKSRQKRELTDPHVLSLHSTPVSKNDNITLHQNNENETIVNEFTTSEYSILKSNDIRNKTMDILNSEFEFITSNTSLENKTTNYNFGNISDTNEYMSLPIYNLAISRRNLLQHTIPIRHIETTTTSLKATFTNGLFTRNKNSSKNYRKELKYNLESIVKKIFNLKDHSKEGKENNRRDSFNINNYIINKLKKMFHKKYSTNTTRCPFKKRSVISVLCRRYGPCNLNLINNTILQKEKELQSESRKIMKSVQIIKGLLKLFFGQNNVSNSLNSSNNDLEKLKIILHDKYLKINSTEIQRRQIYYIKQNTKSFISSIQNFASLLNELIELSIYNNKSRQFQHLKALTFQLKMQDRENETTFEKLEKLKKILVNYNLLQNKFMKKMYETLNSLEMKINKQNNPKVSEHKLTTQRLPRNINLRILDNLRKLKDLLKKLSFKKRRKRATLEDDDAIDLLLILMEYLLKQNKPAVEAPVNDGIDAIIEAIRSSPNLTTTKRAGDMELSKISQHFEFNNKFDKRNHNDYNKLDTKESNEVKSTAVINNLILQNDTEDTKNTRNNNILVDKENQDYQDENRKFEDKIMINQYDSATSSSKLYNIFTDNDTDEEELISTTSESITTAVTNKKKVTSKLFFQIYNETQDQDISQLKWVEDTFDNELKDSFKNSRTTTELPETQVTEKTDSLKKITDKYANPISISNETEEDNELNKNTITDDTFILDSLPDLGKFETSPDSKEEKFDPFPSYFN